MVMRNKNKGNENGNMVKVKRFLSLVILLTVIYSFYSVFLVHHSVAEPMDFYCSGPKSRMTGCTGIAASSGYESAFFNPALISAKKNFGLGYLFASQKVEVELNGKKLDKVGNPLENVSQINAGLSWRLSDLPIFEESKVLEHISIGLASLLPTGKQLIRVGNVETKTPSTLLYGNRNSHFSAFAGLSGNIPVAENFKLFLGVGGYFFADLPIFIDANLSPDKDLVIIDGALESKPGFIGGAAVEYSSENIYMRVGGVGRSSLYINIPTKVNAYLTGEKILSLTAALVDSFVPGLFGVGLAGGYKSEAFSIHLGFDFARYQFSKFKPSLLEVQSIEPQEIGGTLSGLLPKHELKLKDVNVIKVGGMGEIPAGKTKFLIGAGLSLFPSPFENQINLFFVDSDRTIVSGGLGISAPSPFLVKGDLEFIVSGQLHMISQKQISSQGKTASIKGNLPVISAVLNINY
jgi:hypothetical protein